MNLLYGESLAEGVSAFTRNLSKILYHTEANGIWNKAQGTTPKSVKGPNAAAANPIAIDRFLVANPYVSGIALSCGSLKIRFDAK